MLEIQVRDVDGSLRPVRTPDECLIGRGADCAVRLDSWRIGRDHARLHRTPSGVLVEDRGTLAGVRVNGARIDQQYGPLLPEDEIFIGPFRLTVRELDPDRPGDSARPDSDGIRSTLAHDMGETDRDGRPARMAQGEVIRQRQDPAAAGPRRPHAEAAEPEPAPPTVAEQKRLDLEFTWRRRLHARLLETMDLRRQDVQGMSDEQLRDEADALVRHIMTEEDGLIPGELDRDLLRKQVLDEAIGLGPLEELLADDSVTEIMVNRYDEIYVERAGKLLRHPLTFTGDRVVMGVIERIVAPLGRRIDEASPMVDARLKDGSRVNAIIPPLALKGSCITIRKFAKRRLSTDDLIAYGSINEQMAEFLRVCVEARKNIIVSGGTGSGKTTLLNVLSNFIPDGERIITVEDSAELRLHHEHLIGLESRPANAEGRGAVPIRELVRNTLRMRPDRIVVGECRGAEALDMLQAMNTGHEGSLTTLHANSPRDGLARLETMVLMAGMELPLAAIRDQITSAVDIIVQQTRFACGSRKVTSISEVTGIESGAIQLQEIFRFEPRGYGQTDRKIQGEFTGCELPPTFYEELRATGVPLDIGIFRRNPALGESLADSQS